MLQALDQWGQSKKRAGEKTASEDWDWKSPLVVFSAAHALIWNMEQGRLQRQNVNKFIY